jgi:uncharacterized OB-fold protein
MEKLINENFFRKRGRDLIVIGSKCRSCKKVYFPKKRLCTVCYELDNMDEVELSKKGRLVTYTVSYMPSVGINPPYAFGYVDLPEGVRLFTLLTKCEPFEEKLKVDMDVEMIIERMTVDEYGNDIITYKFKPVE